MVSVMSNIKTFFRKMVKRQPLSDDRGGGQCFAHDEYSVELTLEQVGVSFNSLQAQYCYFDRYFHDRVPEFVREHRAYFRQSRRGFGEDAMHAMWWLIFVEFRPQKCLEIGVYRGQVLSLWRLISKFLHERVRIAGVSPLGSNTDEVTVGGYRNDLDYRADILEHFSYFELEPPELCEALSTDEAAINFIESEAWDLIYVDGSHDLDVVRADVDVSSRSLSPAGLLVLDDSSLYADYDPPEQAFAGHPGPSQVAEELKRDDRFRYLGCVGHNTVFQLK